MWPETFTLTRRSFCKRYFHCAILNLSFLHFSSNLSVCSSFFTRKLPKRFFFHRINYIFYTLHVFSPFFFPLHSLARSSNYRRDMKLENKIRWKEYTMIKLSPSNSWYQFTEEFFEKKNRNERIRRKKINCFLMKLYFK